LGAFEGGDESVTVVGEGVAVALFVHVSAADQAVECLIDGVERELASG
jgi:hypothetical protein